ncbi:MAG: cohesin domain-containing protein [Acetatifactor sp.]|nr:cohesin domain-containing protein [Acetatifactor sp.]
MESKETNKKKKKWLILLLLLLLLLLVIGGICFRLFSKKEKVEETSAYVPGAPAVTIETPGKKSVGDKESFSLDIQLTSLGQDSYPAASFSIDFDPSRLEFVGLEEGNVFIHSPRSSAGYDLPNWNVDVERSNQIGQINILYLDMTGGECAFSQDLLAEKDNVLFRLRFRLRGSVREGDILELNLVDAVFANADESKSLSKNTGTLITNNGRIIVGE